jgi:hypothetical protein
VLRKVIGFEWEEAIVQCGALCPVIMINEDNCDGLVKQHAWERKEIYKKKKVAGKM